MLSVCRKDENEEKEAVTGLFKKVVIVNCKFITIDIFVHFVH